MRIIVDGDGCPVIDITIKIAKYYELEIIVVKDYSHDLWDEYATIVTVDEGHDSVDLHIVNNVKKKDIVVTQDYGLAAMALTKGAICITQNGKVISSNNIDHLLARRHFNQQIRKKYKHYPKIKKRSPEQDNFFKENLKKLIESMLN